MGYWDSGVLSIAVTTEIFLVIYNWGKLKYYYK